MGSTTPPDSSKELEHSETPVNDPTKSEELERLLKIKDQEIRSLRFQLEKYKLALSQSQVEQHQQRVLPADSRPTTGDNNESLLGFPQTADASLSACPTTETILSEVVGSRKVAPTAAAAAASHDEISDASLVEASLSKESPSHSSSRMLARQSTASACSATSGFGGKVVFKTGTDGEEDDDDNDDRGEEHDGKVHDKDGAFKLKQEVRDANASQSEGVPMGVDDLYSVIQDVGEIDLTSELKRERKRRRRVRAISLNSDIKSIDKGLCDEEDDDDDEEDRENNADRDGGNDADADDDDDDDEVEDIISEGLLTSLTDAAISNLSQLAALQERCESQDSSQQQPSRYPEQQQPLAHSEIRSAAIEPQVPSAAPFASHISATTPLASIVSSSSSSSTCLGSLGRRSQRSDVSSARELDTGYNPFSASNIASQAALAISAAAAAAAAASVHQEPNSSSPQSINLAHPPSSSLSPPSSATTNLHADLSSGQSLASAVAAAAVAAANDQVQQAHHHHSHHAHNTTHQLHSTPQSRLISSALSSPEFYHNLQQQHQRSQQAALPHQMSPISALHSYSPTTPSPSSLLAQSRRPGSNASSSFMSPICSPNYLRRQFMPDRLQPMMSPSPSSLTTGSSSAASTSLAHILQQHQQHHQQQRSASAMAGPITSTSTTPLSGTGSSVMSPLMNSKNSSQARLNNMQIRHKFGYLGSGRGQFNSPHGFCLGLNQEIVVADTNNHRICIFDKSGSYITQFGSPGKEEGQLWNPRKVAILHRTVSGASGGGGGGAAISGSVGQHHHHHQRQVGQVAASTYSSHFTSTGGIQNTNAGTSGQLAASEPLYVVCDRGAERSRMQLFTKDGSFIKKIGIHYIDIVAGLAITQNGLIIVVDSVSPTVYIINAETGTLNGWFDCSGHMKEPSDIAVKSEIPGNEYFICDFKGHCVVVFNEQGEYLRKIGHDGLTSYPNGIDISDDGDILVGDSHGNRFHVVVFDRNGNFVSQFECPHVKVSRCCGLKITREGYIVTLAKNNHHVLVLDTIHI